MTRNDQRTGLLASDDGFERALLDSASADHCPTDTADAWSRFEARLATAAFIPGALAPTPPRAAPSEATTPPSPLSSWRYAAKWMVLGVVGGAALTAGLLAGGSDPAAPPGPPPAVLRTHDESRPPFARHDGTPTVTRVPVEHATSHDVSPRAVEPVPPTDRRNPAAGPRGHAFADAAHGASTLGAQVILIDRARAALANGEPAAALQLVERFHAELAGGALEPDAEVIAIEALAAQHRGAEMARRATRFLQGRPNDPHAPRLRHLLQAPASGSP